MSLLAKQMAIYISRKNKIGGSLNTDATMVWRRNLHCRIYLGFNFFQNDEWPRQFRKNLMQQKHCEGYFKWIILCWSIQRLNVLAFLLHLVFRVFYFCLFMYVFNYSFIFIFSYFLNGFCLLWLGFDLICCSFLVFICYYFLIFFYLCWKKVHNC